jgi:hypothetical protein
MMTETKNLLEIECLGGHDVCRHLSTIVVQIDDGQLRDGQYGEPLTISLGGDLMGWGKLDGESYHVGNGVWYVSVPRKTLRAIAARDGLRLPDAA